MIKEIGYCNYHDKKWVERYNGLTYCKDGSKDEYYTEIIENTFYINKIDVGSVIRNTIFQISKTVCIIPMIKVQEETIRDILRSWNFNVKYKWLDEDLEPESKKLLDSYIDELDCGNNGNIPAKQCPTCGYTDPCDFEDVNDVKYEYCPMCGQKLDREGEN